MKKQFSIKEYLILTSAVLSVNNSSTAQVIYNDIDPDIVLDENDEYGFLDLDNNGEIDFGFLRGFATFTDPTFYGSPGGQHTRIVQWAGGYISDNILAGSNRFFTEPYGGSFSRYYPYALDTFKSIPSELSFQNWGYQRIAFKSYGSGNLSNTGGNWFPEQTDKYLGVRFIDSDENNHYGWIRCSVLDSADVLIIKDFAYESEPDKPIMAGDPLYTIDTSDTNGLEVTIYSFNSDIYIQMNDLSFNYQVRIFNNLGQLIRKQEITELNSVIALHNVAMGNYFVEVSSGDRKIVEKVFIN